MSKLIILRGPSAAGKSTVAKALQKQSERKTVIIEQDYYRETLFATDKKESSIVRRVMLVTDCLIALEYGYDVILEGIMSSDNYQACFDQLFAKHTQENYVFYFEVSFEESVRRHNLRDKKSDFDEAEMKEWYARADKSGIEGEVVIPEGNTLEETIATIQRAKDGESSTIT